MNPFALSTKGPDPKQHRLLASAVSDENIDCWKRIGIFGDRSCTELRQYIHCHHCPVHSAAGVQLLSRPLPANYKRERTQDFARPRHLRESNNFSAVLFRLQTEWLALPTRIFLEATEPKTIHSLPHRRNRSLLGLSNVRGELLMVVSLAHFLGLQTGSPTRVRQLGYHRLLVIQCEGGRLAFPVDEVQGPHRFHLDELGRPPSAGRIPVLARSQGVLHWQDRAVGLVDLDALLSAFQRTFR